ncbi:hypothetical protein L226DRAFT_523737 [Lentinus tigrinus ALCF2SS1-7]|uniref:Uncharacterized protein n=1 Tax=Lentinus tigrinus ALCF2SS1-6 TaxID=1328759 RepID=A0A5C2RYH5_9APHY|nr:hypothetical protein L227DRAFT_566217 [Lentinus tigrinus ALCF2SS1-6]RPD74003.1 hypothetical protein L226DRAFT_523737 [Lentinus tigrinus ALCF2SS1-7]
MTSARTSNIYVAAYNIAARPVFDYLILLSTMSALGVHHERNILLSGRSTIPLGTPVPSPKWSSAWGKGPMDVLNSAAVKEAFRLFGHSDLAEVEEFQRNGYPYVIQDRRVDSRSNLLSKEMPPWTTYGILEQRDKRTIPYSAHEKQTIKIII